MALGLTVPWAVVRSLLSVPCVTTDTRWGYRKPWRRLTAPEAHPSLSGRAPGTPTSDACDSVTRSDLNSSQCIKQPSRHRRASLRSWLRWLALPAAFRVLFSQLCRAAGPSPARAVGDLHLNWFSLIIEISQVSWSCHFPQDPCGSSISQWRVPHAFLPSCRQ